MLIYLFLCLNLWIVSTNPESINRLRRQSPFADGIQPSIERFEPRRILSHLAHRKAESHVFPFSPHCCWWSRTFFFSFQNLHDRRSQTDSTVGHRFGLGDDSQWSVAPHPRGRVLIQSERWISIGRREVTSANSHCHLVPSAPERAQWHLQDLRSRDLAR